MKLASFVDELERAGDKHSKGYANVAKGLFVPPIKLGAKSVIPTYETDAIIAARIAGKSDDEIRALVRQLVEARKQVATAA